MRTYIISSFIDKKIEYYATKLLSLKTLRSIKRNWEKHFKEICEHYSYDKVENSIENSKSTYIEFEGKLVNVNTVTKAVTAVRAKIEELSKKNKSNEKVVKWLLENGVKIDKSTRKGVVDIPPVFEQKRENVILKKTEERKRTLQKIESLADMYQVCYEMLDNPTWYKKLIALSFFTGRRISEICQTGKLTYTRGNKGVLRFRGQLKTTNHIGYTIPIMHQKKVMACWRSLRELRNDFEDMHIDELSNTITTSSNRVVKKLFGKEMTMHKLRSIYALYMEHYCNKDIHKTTFIADVLGHTAGNKGNVSSATERYELLSINFDLPSIFAEEISNINYRYKEF